MKGAKVITMCHWRRPEYTRLSLEYLSRCHGISDYTVIMHIDGGENRKVISQCKAFRSAKNPVVVEKSKHIGCNENTKQALESGFAISDYVIHIEDDILVARDGLKFMEWARQFDGDPRIFTTSIWRHHNGWMPEQGRPWTPGHERFAGLYQFFFVWGWATWESRWKEIKAAWTKGGDKTDSWDMVISRDVLKGRCSLTPFISRANNIGQDMGTHRGASQLSHWADSPGFVEPGRFERV